MKFYQLANKRDGVFTFNRDNMRHLIENLFEGQYIISFQRVVPKSNVKEYRACYFAKIDMIASEVGETRYDVHTLVKEHIIEPMLNELPDLFTQNVISTRVLTLSGWVVLLERLDLWAFTEYSVILN